MKGKKPNKSVNYKVVRYFTPSSITASQTTENQGGSARKRFMSQPLTYQALLDNLNRQVEIQTINTQTAANRATVLRSFLRANRLNMDDVIGSEMRVNHIEALERFFNYLADEGKSNRDISNYRSMMRRWKEAVVELDTTEALNAGNQTPFQETLRSVIADLPVALVARRAGIPKDMLWGWLRGKIPRAGSARYLLRLENFFGLERNLLVNLSGMRPYGFKQTVGGTPAPVPFNQKIVELTKLQFCVKPDESSLLREQWNEFLRYKTSAAPSYKRSRMAKWRFSPCPITPLRPSSWFEFLDGREVASARINWYKMASYLGWLGLDKNEGGLGMAKEVSETMAWLAVPDHIEQYIEWHRKRVGALNRGVLQFFGFIGSVVRPEVGYLRQRPEFLKTLPPEYGSYDWDALCQRQFELLDQLTQSYKDEIVASRTSMEPLKHILQAPQPMDAMADMIQRIRADRPVGQPRREAFWARDLMLLRMLISNPLRFRMLASLTWRADNTGELYQRPDKSWWIHISRAKFKNVKGAAGDGDYDSQIHPSAWRDIERYLFIFRPKLLREPTDLVFLTMPSHGVTEHRPWEGLSQHVARLTERYLVRCVGIRAHAFRHIVATSILKANGGDYKTAALVLNDRPVTVERHYAWLRSNDGSERMAELLDSSFKRM